MYTIFETGGKQYRVSVGDTIDIDKVDCSPGDTLDFDRVLMVVGSDKTLIGRPTLPQAKVIGEILQEVKGPKITVFKHKRRKDYRKKIGHRQHLTRVAIRKIETGTQQERSATARKVKSDGT